MFEFINIIKSNYANVTKMTIYNSFKTGNPMYDAIISTICISIFGYGCNYMYEHFIDKMLYNMSIDDIKSLFYKKNTIIIEGKRSSVISAYTLSHNISTLYSERFKAILNYIINNMDRIDTIYKIKEAHSNFQSSSSDKDDKRQIYDIFMVNQSSSFEIDEHIYVNTIIELEESKEDKEKPHAKTDKITINIYSYVYSLHYLKTYVDKITHDYLLSIKDYRNNKQFIYSLDKVIYTDSESILDCWREDIFESSRTFNNMFFDGKDELLTKLDFFLQNRKWYFEKGIPYSLGIGLHGPPGTGKTSLIKAIANYTKRHIIVISLKLIKTKKQLEQFFFENRYHSNNLRESIPFDKKIIVFEDIDCILDIISNRNPKPSTTPNSTPNTSTDILSEVLHTICDNKMAIKDDLITMDDILNLFDGIRETPGRIIFVTSNHYKKLDPALVRPGRIDITKEMGNSSYNNISQIYFHLFQKKIDPSVLNNIKELFYSPAELMNIYISHTTEEDFINRLLQHSKV
jgi:SpoVK/Ycf46/Vps4 family AAA+-type ATPase